MNWLLEKNELGMVWSYPHVDSPPDPPFTTTVYTFFRTGQKLCFLAVAVAGAGVNG